MSFLRLMRKKIYRNYTELYLKCDRRISNKRDLEIMEGTARYGTEKKIAFSNYFYQRKRNLTLLKEYFNQKIITSTEYVLSITYLLVVPIIRTIKNFLFIKNFEIDVIENFAYTSNILTFPAGVKRLFPKLEGCEIEEINVAKQKYPPKIRERIIIFVLCVFYNVYNYSLMLQYHILKRSLLLIDFKNKKIIVEEGRNPTQICFLDFAQKKSIPVIISYRGIPPISRYYFGFKIITTNIISKNKLLKYNSDVQIVSKPYLLNFNRLLTKKNQRNAIGFLSDVGGGGITLHEKKILDLFINKISKKYKISIIVSIHPQERERKGEYYNSIFTSKNIEFRKGEILEDYINEIDILVGRTSTAVFQALLAKIPIIILDLFNDKPMEKLTEYSEGLIRYATEEDSFLECYDYFYAMKKNEINRRYNQALSNLEIQTTF
jgi:hypothetical protein